MSGPPDAKAVRLEWRELAARMRDELTGKLVGLYEQGSDAQAFDALAVDKQQSLLILARRLIELDLWKTVRRVENVYGTGGVGMDFKAWPRLLSTLRHRKDFTSLFASHRNTTGGFIERHTARAALHFLYLDQPQQERKWAAHFDLYNPWALPFGAWRHLWHEKIGRQTPDWRNIKATMNSER